MKKFKTHRGFTLIELLVVVAIIGILAAIVLTSLSSAKNKGGDAGVQTDLGSIRNQAELFYSNNNNSYLPAGGSTFAIATCPTYSASGTNMLAKDQNLANEIAGAVGNGKGSACYNSATNWAVAVALKSGGTAGDTIPDSWCVDNTGISKSYTWAAGETITNSINVNVCK